MLTVKHIKKNGFEAVYPAFHTEFRRANEEGEQDRLLLFTEAHFVVAELNTGVAYVMNPQGNTVSKHEFVGDGF